jgi:signal transduction histidine kinase
MRETELLSQWSGMVVHDLKNHLSPLRMIVRNMQGRLDNPAFLGEAVEDLASVTAQMERLMSRLGELRGGTTLARHAVELAPLCREVVHGLRAEAHPALRVVLDLEEVTVAGDAPMIRRVVENFVTNAVEAMDGKGTLGVTVRRAPGPGSAEHARLEVRDTGAGMDPAFLSDRLFRPFATTKRGGLGLGLYQCRLIVEAHGGEIRVESAPGRGTVMTAVFPEVWPEASRDGAAVTAAGEGGER